MIVAACPDQGAGKDLKALGLAFPTFVNAYVKLLRIIKANFCYPKFQSIKLTSFHTVGNMGVLLCLGQWGLRSPSASSSFTWWVLFIVESNLQKYYCFRSVPWAAGRLFIPPHLQLDMPGCILLLDSLNKQLLWTESWIIYWECLLCNDRTTVWSWIWIWLALTHKPT